MVGLLTVSLGLDLYHDSNAHCVLDPKIQLLHHLLATRPQQTQSRINKALNTDRQLFFSLPYFCFHISVFSTCL